MRWFSLRNSFFLHTVKFIGQKLFQGEFGLKRLQNLTQPFLKRTRKITVKCHAHKASFYKKASV